MKINTILIDDEHNAIRSLEILIQEHCPQLHIIGTASTIKQGVELIRLHQPDLVFLDIEMPTGSGFEVIEQTAALHYHVIFTTAYEQYATKAFRVSAIDYLLKPIDVSELVQAVQKAVDKNHLKLTVNSIQEILRHSRDAKLSLPTNDGFRILNTNEIMRIESDSNYCWIYLNQGSKFIVPRTLKDLEVQLQHQGFIRVHHSHLINQIFISRYIKTEGGMLVLSDGSEIPVSRRKKAEILAFFQV